MDYLLRLEEIKLLSTLMLLNITWNFYENAFPPEIFEISVKSYSMPLQLNTILILKSIQFYTTHLTFDVYLYVLFPFLHLLFYKKKSYLDKGLWVISIIRRKLFINQDKTIPFFLPLWFLAFTHFILFLALHTLFFWIIRDWGDNFPLQTKIFLSYLQRWLFFQGTTMRVIGKWVKKIWLLLNIISNF